MAKAQKENQIFISYRGEDDPGITGRIYDRLVQKFGKKAIFKDVDSLPLGETFETHINSAISQCKIVLVIMGPRWIGIKDEKGISRIQAPYDYVRMEIEEAIRQNKPIIPLLINNTKMPRETDVPASIKELIYQSGMDIGYDPNFHFDIDYLIRKLKKYLETQPASENSLSDANKPSDTDLVKKSVMKQKEIDYIDYTEPATRATIQRSSVKQQTKSRQRIDVFLSHASEDKTKYVLPFAKEL